VSQQRIAPPALRPGDTVGVVNPGAAVEREPLERGIGVLTSMGWRVKVSERALARDGILAGTDRERASELMAYFADPDVRAIFCARGGYGCGRLLPLLDFDAIARTPKPFVGFSDGTFILNPLVERARMVAFHGPMVAMDLSRVLTARSREHLACMLSGELGAPEFEARESIHPGVAEGEVIGGCLSVIVAMLATPYVPDFTGRIVFFEDTGERAYRIDRMLVQLRQASVLGRAAGIVFGAIRPVDGSEHEARLIARFVAEQTAGLGIPVIAGIEAGHGTENLALPLGARARLDASRRRLSFTQSPVTRARQ
jgi:muramoyltetrapeptide carboxypeptidase